VAQSFKAGRYAVALESGGESVLVRPGHLSEMAAAPPVPPADVAKGDTPSEGATPSWESLLARASRMAQSVGQSLAEAFELDAASGVQRRLLGSVELSALFGAVAAGCCVACCRRRRRRRERRFDQLADEPDQSDHQELHGEGRSEALGTERRKRQAAYVPQLGDRVKHGRRGEGIVAELLPDGRSRIVFEDDEEYAEHRYIGQLDGAAPLDSPQRRQATWSQVEEATRRAKLEASAAAGRRALKELQKEQARQKEAQQEAQFRQLLQARLARGLSPVPAQSLLGERVVLGGLSARPDLNGRRGVARSFEGDPGGGRYVVHLEGSGGSGERGNEVVRVRPENLLPGAGLSDPAALARAGAAALS